MKIALGRHLMGLPGPIMLTGHTGFKGTWMTYLLEQLNIPTVGLSLPPQRDSLFARANRTGAIPEEFIDIGDLKSISKFMVRFKPSVVIHMAAQPLVLESYISPRNTFEVNVLGTVNVLDSAFNSESVKAVAVVTTDKVYRNNNQRKDFVETDPLEGKDPYSASKVATESVVAAWQQIARISGGPKVISMRAGNVIGGGDWAKNRLLPDLIKGFKIGEVVEVRNPESTRPWQFVLDPLSGYLLALEAVLNGEFLDCLNFGPADSSLKVRQVVDIARSIWPEKTEVKFKDNKINDITEAQNLNLDSTNARRTLGWEPILSQHDSVRTTVDWWRKVIIDQVSPEMACKEDVSMWSQMFKKSTQPA